MEKIREWYHEKHGGMWMSRKTMKKGYQNTKNEVKKLQENEKAVFKKGDEDAKKLFDQLSYFRTLLTQDLGTRRGFIFKEEEDD